MKANCFAHVLGRQVIKGVVYYANIATGNRNVEENGLYALLISRQEEIIGLVKPLLPKLTMKPRVIHITVTPLVSLRIMCVYSTNAIIVLFKVSC